MAAKNKLLTVFPNPEMDLEEDYDVEGHFVQKKWVVNNEMLKKAA